MDVVTFAGNGDGSDRYDANMFAAQNTPNPGGYIFFMGGDTHRAELAAQGNTLGIYFNNLTVNIQETNPQAMINTIQSYCMANFTASGLVPTWITLNEISGSLWPSDATYRAWVKTVVHALHVTYGHEVLLYAPFSNPANNSADWKSVTQDAYIGVENYLSGTDLLSHNFSVSWAESQYKSSITSYGNVGVPASRLIEGEDYSMTTAGTGYGRDGVSFADWDSTIIAREQALHDLGTYFGFIGYAWSKNAMLDTEADQVHFIQTFRASRCRDFWPRASRRHEVCIRRVRRQNYSQPNDVSITRHQKELDDGRRSASCRTTEIYGSTGTASVPPCGDLIAVTWVASRKLEAIIHFASPGRLSSRPAAYALLNLAEIGGNLVIRVGPGGASRARFASGLKRSR